MGGCKQNEGVVMHEMGRDDEFLLGGGITAHVRALLCSFFRPGGLFFSASISPFFLSVTLHTTRTKAGQRLSNRLARQVVRQEQAGTGLCKQEGGVYYPCPENLYDLHLVHRQPSFCSLCLALWIASLDGGSKGNMNVISWGGKRRTQS